jgi:protein-tyrosine-phosphatase
VEETGEKKRVLFVCTGNMCRSPLAEGIFRSLLPKDGAGRIEVLSAGTNTIDGERPTDLAEEVASENGIDIGGIRSRRLTPGLVRASDLIVVMTRAHRASVLFLAPEADTRIVLLRDLLPASDPWAGKELPDPIGGPIEAYRETYRGILDALAKGWTAIERRLFGKGSAERDSTSAGT